MRWALAVALSWLLLTSSVAAPAPANLAPKALKARIALLRPEIEKALGFALPKDLRVEHADPKEFEDALLYRAVGHKRAHEGVQVAWPLRATTSVFGKPLVLIKAATFEKLAAKKNPICGTQDFLDLLLVKESVHVAQQLRPEFKYLLPATGDAEKSDCLATVLEGHALHVAQEVAKARKTTRAFAVLLEINDGVRDPMGIDGVDSRLGLRFVSKVIEKLGLEKATEKLFTSTVRKSRDLGAPEAWLDPSAPRMPDAAEVLKAVVTRLRLERATVQMADRAFLRQTLSTLPKATLEPALDAFRDGAGARATSKGHRTVLVLLRADSPEGAAKLARIWRSYERKEDREMREAPTGKPRLIEAKYTNPSVGDAAGFQIERGIALGGETMREVVLVQHVESWVLILSRVAPKVAASTVRSLTKRALGVVAKAAGITPEK